VIDSWDFVQELGEGFLGVIRAVFTLEYGKEEGLSSSSSKFATLVNIGFETCEARFMFLLARLLGCMLGSSIFAAASNNRFVPMGLLMGEISLL
jgi:hypothetical protein